jgi:hypothetical protein
VPPSLLPSKATVNENKIGEAFKEKKKQMLN